MLLPLSIHPMPTRAWACHPPYMATQPVGRARPVGFAGRTYTPYAIVRPAWLIHSVDGFEAGGAEVVEGLGFDGPEAGAGAGHHRLEE
jgi:hypothetical protein